jgi:hypothetical protein
MRAREAGVAGSSATSHAQWYALTLTNEIQDNTPTSIHTRHEIDTVQSGRHDIRKSEHGAQSKE